MKALVAVTLLASLAAPCVAAAEPMVDAAHVASAGPVATAARVVGGGAMQGAAPVVAGRIAGAARLARAEPIVGAGPMAGAAQREGAGPGAGGGRTAMAPEAGCAQPSTVYKEAKPWAQRLLAPERAWPLTTGTGVTVAVIGTGVDAANAQFRPDQVGAGTDVSGSGRRADEDCDGRGTFAAGLIAAQPTEETAFAGIAPGVRILPIRYTEATDRGGDEGDPDRLAAAIRAATAARVEVICVAVPTTVDSAALDRAVAEARAADIVVVSSAVAGQGAKSYPTADSTVIAVGAVGADGSAAGAEAGDHIDVAAPGRDLVSLGAGAGGRLGHIGPVAEAVAYSAAFVAGTAALVRAYRPDLDAAAVVARIVRTAGGSGDPRLGNGIVNLYAAVAAEGVDGAAKQTGPAPVVVGPMAEAPKPASNGAALVIAVAAMALAAMVAVGAAAVRRGRTRLTPPGAERPRR